MVQSGGYPFWFDDVPKGMSRDQYMRLKKSKPKNKSMKVWIKGNKKNMKKYTKKRKTGRGSVAKRHAMLSNRRRLIRSRKIQRGGFLPACLPCITGPAIAVTGLGTAGYMVSKSSSSKTMNGKTVHSRKETYKLKKNGKQVKKVFKQKNNKIYLNDKEIKPTPKTTNEATKILNKKIKECIKSGFKKC